jgi:anti-sigma regulatory factor (Ser/Thr protein kinase)
VHPATGPHRGTIRPGPAGPGPRSEGGAPIRAEIMLAPVPASAREARWFVGRVLAEWGDTQLVEAAALLVSELVTNAVTHAGSEVHVVVGRGGRYAVLRVEVGDFSSTPPTVGGFDLEAMSGRGLALVEALSHRWGVETHGSGKRVWFELADGAAG